MKNPIWVLGMMILLLSFACGGGGGGTADTGSGDTGTTDTGISDSGEDAGDDSGEDSGEFDGGADTGKDGGFDGGRDAGIPDGGGAAGDAGADTGTDAGFDGGAIDAGPTYCLTSQCFMVPPTGQTKCYNDLGAELSPCPANRTDSFWGQDAQFQKARTLTCSGGACSTSAAAAGEVVTDSVTGLVWQRTFVSGNTWQAAADYCKSLDYAGQQDWHLSNPFELASLANNQNFGPAIDTTVFPGTQSDNTWTSSSVAFGSGRAWYLFFGQGYIADGIKSSTLYARCVRPKSDILGINRFVVTEPVAGEQVVSDSITGLMWEKNFAADKAWKDALSYCAVLNYGGFADWRLPNKNELMSLLNYARFNQATNFPGMPNSGFWASSSFSDYPGFAWYIGFIYGEVGDSLKSNAYDARCVRLGP